MKNFVFSRWLVATIALLCYCASSIRANQPRLESTQAETVTLLYPADDTTIACPSPQIMLSWKKTTESTALVSYHIQVSTEPNFTAFPLLIDDVILGPGNVVTRSTLPSQTTARTLYWRVTTSFTTDWSKVWRINAVVSAPKEPTDLSPADNSTACMSQELSWTNPPGTKTVLFKATKNAPDGPLLRLDSGGAGVHSINMSTSSSTTIVYWQVIAYDSSGTPHASTARKLTITVPAPVTLLEPQNGSTLSEKDSIILLRWVMNPEAKLYIISLSGPGSYQRYDTVVGSNLPISKAGLALGDYSWRIRSMCDNTNGGSYTTPFGFRIVLFGDDVHDDMQVSTLCCSPNPIRQSARIAFPPSRSAVAYAQIVNECGAVVYRCTKDEVLNGQLIWSPESSSQSAGLYFFMLYDGKDLYHSTLAVEKE